MHRTRSIWLSCAALALSWGFAVHAQNWPERPMRVVVPLPPGGPSDIVLRNGQSRIRLGADGDVEIVCANFATRSRRLLRLLAPMIKMN